MAIAFRCEHCDKEIIIPDSLAEKRVICPACALVITAPMITKEGKEAVYAMPGVQTPEVSVVEEAPSTTPLPCEVSVYVTLAVDTASNVKTDEVSSPVTAGPLNRLLGWLAAIRALKTPQISMLALSVLAMIGISMLVMNHPAVKFPGYWENRQNTHDYFVITRSDGDFVFHFLTQTAGKQSTVVQQRVVLANYKNGVFLNVSNPNIVVASYYEPSGELIIVGEGSSRQHPTELVMYDKLGGAGTERAQALCNAPLIEEAKALKP